MTTIKLTAAEIRRNEMREFDRLVLRRATWLCNNVKPVAGEVLKYGK